MSLTNIVYTPVDTGTAKVSPNVDNTKVKDFYLLTGKWLQLRRRQSVPRFIEGLPSPLLP